MTVYVVVSSTISYGQTFSGVHGVYSSKDSARLSALSAATGIAQRHCYNVTKDDITIDDDNCIYTSSKVDVVVSCIEQRLL